MTTAVCTVSNKGDNAVLFTWVLTQNQDGAPIGEQWADFRDRTVQFSGTWDSATAVWQGSNGPAASPVYGTLNDAQGSAITKTVDAGPEQVMESTLLQRPNTSGAGATQSVTCSVLAVRTQQPRG